MDTLTILTNLPKLAMKYLNLAQMKQYFDMSSCWGVTLSRPSVTSTVPVHISGATYAHPASLSGSA